MEKPVAASSAFVASTATTSTGIFQVSSRESPLALEDEDDRGGDRDCGRADGYEERESGERARAAIKGVSLIGDVDGRIADDEDVEECDARRCGGDMDGDSELCCGDAVGERGELEEEVS